MTGKGEVSKSRASGISLPSARKFFEQSFIWVLLALILLVGTLVNPVFITPRNLLNILVASAALGCLVLAQAPVIILAEIDLSTEAMMIFIAILGATMMKPIAPPGAPYPGGLGLPWWVALITMLVVSTLLGLVNGLLIVQLPLVAFMETLAASVIFAGLSLLVSKGHHVVQIPEAFRWVGGGKIGPVPVAVLFLLFVFGIYHVLLTRTPFGRKLFAVGSNRLAARAAGINDNRVKITAFTMSGLMSGVAAWVLVGRLGTASTALSSGQLFISIASCVLGGVSLMGGRGTIPGILGGLLVMSSITNALNMANIPIEYVNIATGAVILIAIVIDALRARRLKRS